MKKQDVIFHSFVVITALLGSIILLVSTLQGMGVGGDATIYLTTARNMLAGNGMGLLGPKGEFRLIPYAPPFFSIILSFFGLFHFDLVSADKFLNLLFYFAFILWIGESLFWLTKSRWVAWITAVLFTFSPVMIPVYSWVMTEPPLLFFGFGGLILLLVYLFRNNQRWLFYASAVGVGLAFVTHYKAAPFLLTGALVVLFFSRGKWLDRFKEAFVYGLLGFIPMIAWLVYSVPLTSGLASRSLVDVQGMAAKIANLIDLLNQVFLFWFIPDSWITGSPYPSIFNKVLLFGAFFILVVWFAWAIWKLGKSTDGDQGKIHEVRVTAISLGIFILVYFAMIVGVHLVIYPSITINSRMLSPMFVAVLWLGGLLAAYTLQEIRLKKWMKIGLVGIAVVLIGWYGMRSLKIVQTNYQVGMGYQMKTWKDSDTLQAVKNLPSGTLIVTNEELLILYWLDIPSYPLAEIYWIDPVEQYYRYGDGDLTEDSAQRAFREEGAVLVLFNTIYDQFGTKYGDRTQERIKQFTDELVQVYSGSDGAIYRYP